MGTVFLAVFAGAEKVDLARAGEPMPEDLVEVRHDLGLAGTLLQPGLGAALLHIPVPEHRRCHAVEHRSLVELDKRIRVGPVPSGRVPPIDDYGMRIGMIDQMLNITLTETVT